MSLLKPIFYTALVCAVTLGGSGDGQAQGESLVLAAIGDSISAGTNSSWLGDNRNLSWSTGTKTESNSHLKKLSTLLGVQVVGKNEAVAGSRITDLGRQIDRVLPQNPDYLTITVGANDVCSWNADHGQALTAFEGTLDAHIQKIVNARPDIRIYLASIPDMHNLWEVAKTHSGCQTRWNMFSICLPLLGSDVTDLDRQAFVDRWQDANNAIASVADRFPDNVFYDPAMAQTQFEWQHISGIDCFHPSIAGQNLLSEKTWDSYWFAR